MTAPVLSKVHTYAQDLVTEKSKRETAFVVPKTAVTTPKSTPVVTPVKKPDLPIITTKTDLSFSKKPTPTNVTAPIKISVSATKDASYPAKIITDKKHKRFSLTKALTESVKGAVSHSLRPRKPKNPVYLVPAAELRKGVVTSATSITARGTTSDYKTVAANIQEAKKAKTDNPVVKSNITTTSAPVASTPIHRDDVIAPATPTWETAHTVALDDSNLGVNEAFAIAKAIPDNSTPTLSLNTDQEKALEREEATVTPTIIASIPNPVIRPQINPDLIDTTDDVNNVAPASVPDLQPSSLTTNRLQNVKVTLKKERGYSDTVEEVPMDNLADIDSIDDMEELDTEDREPLDQTDDEPVPVVDEIPEIVTPLVVVPKEFPKILPVIPNVTPAVLPVNLETTPTRQATTDKVDDLNQLRPNLQPSAVTQMRAESNPALPIYTQISKDAIAARKTSLNLQQTSNLPKRSTSAFAAYAPMLVGGLFVCITVGTISYFVVTRNATPEIATNPAITLPSDNTSNVISTGPATTNSITVRLNNLSKSSLFGALVTAKTGTDNYLIITPLSPQSIPLSVTETLGLLNAQMDELLQPYISSVRFAYSGAEPVIIMSVMDWQGARGSLFDWERTIGADLSPWFGSTIKTTDQNSRTMTLFKDTTVNNHDVRIFADEQGQDRVVYGFVNKHTLIITTNKQAFEAVSNNY